MTTRHLTGWALTGSLWMVFALGAGAGETSTVIADMESADDLVLTTGKLEVVDGPRGGKALLYNDAKVPFEGRIDLTSQGIKPGDFDMIKLEVKADRGAFLRVSVENYPDVGDMSHWYVLDTMRGPFDWRTLWVDLTRPEEIKHGGDDRAKWRKGMGEESGDSQGIVLRGSVKDLGNKEQGEERRIWLGKIRLVKEAVHLDWDQTQAPYTWGKGEDLVYTFPLTVSNRLDRPVTARLRLAPFDAREASASVTPDTAPLDPGEARTVKATISLTAKAAAQKPPLYCERFSAFASVDGIKDSEVTILRSSDPIHLTLTVPFPKEKMPFPLLACPSQLPRSVLHYDEALATENAALPPQPLIENAMQHGLYQYGKQKQNTDQFRKTLLASAMLYDMTGEEKYLKTATPLLNALPDIWKKFQSAEEKVPVREISSGVVCRWNDGNHYTLSLGWLVMGTPRCPYYYGTAGNGRAGTVGSVAWAFDMLAAHLDESLRRRVINGFLLPAGIQCRNHYVGDGNQQATANVTAIYAGMAARNWPLVSFGYSSEHGLHSIAKWCFDDDGVQIRKNYQTYTLRPMFWTTELLYGRGLDLYARDGKRLEALVTADSVAKGMGLPFEDRYFWDFVVQHRLKK